MEQLNGIRKGILKGLVPMLLLAGCGETSTAPQENVVAISLTPESAVLADGESVQFNARINGVISSAVIWSVDGVVGGTSSSGTISASGLYTAPQSSVSGEVTIGAMSQADRSKSGSSTVTIIESGQISATQNLQVANYSIISPRDAIVSVEFGPDTSYGLQTWWKPTPPGGGQVNILVAGMRAFTTYHLRALVQLADGTHFADGDHVFTTGGLPASRLPEILVSSPSLPGEGIELLNLINLGTNQVQAIAADPQGNVIWYYDGFNPIDQTTGVGIYPEPIKLLSNGHILIGIGPSSSVALNPADSSPDILNVVREIDLAGNVIREISVTDLNSRLVAAGYSLVVERIHHDVLPLSNGHLILIVNSSKDFTDLPGLPGVTTVLGDALVDLDANLQPTWVWSAFDHLDVNRHPMSFPDWTHANAVIYSPDEGNLMLSLRHQHWILKIDYKNGTGPGDILWRLGSGGDFSLEGGTDPVDWFYAQHAPKIISRSSAGVFSLTLFDNGNNRVLDTTGTVCGSSGAASCYSRVPIFQIDESAKTAKIIWQDKLPVFSFFGGFVQSLLNGSVEFCESASSQNPPTASIFEVTPEETPQVVSQMDVKGQYGYRGFRIGSLYPGVQW